MVPVQILSKKFSGRNFLLSVAGCAALVSLAPLPAQAGFDWTPSEEQAAPAVAGDEVPALPEEALSGPLTPEPDAPPAVPVEPVQNVSDLPVPDQAPVPEMVEQPAVAEISPPRVAAPAPSQRPPTEIRRVRPATPPGQSVDPVSRTNNEIVWAERPRTAQPVPAQSVVAEPAPEVPMAAPLPASLDQSVIQGFGKDLPLAIALRQIAPAHYAYRFANGVSAGQKVSWDGGKPWPHVMSDMLTANGLQVVIQGNVITVEPGSAPVAAPSSSAPTYSKSASSLDEPTALSVDEQASTTPTARELEAKERGDMNDQTYPDTTDAPVVAVNTESSKAPVVDMQNRRRWEAQPGATLRETLEKWAKSAGVELEWMTPYDFPIKNAFAFQGRFDEAVNSMLAAYSREEQRPRGRFYPNLPEGPSVLMIN